MRFRVLPLALLALCLFAADAAAGPLARWRARRAAPCPVCPQSSPGVPNGTVIVPNCGPDGCRLPSAPVPQPVVVPTVMPGPKVVGAAEPVPVTGVGDGKLRERVLLFIVRQQTLRQMEADGFKAAGGPTTPLARDKAEALYDRLTDEMVLGTVREASPKAAAAAGDGPLARLLEWIRTHPEEFAAIVKLLLSLLMLLAEPETLLLFLYGIG